jgi:hypothetical protein
VVERSVVLLSGKVLENPKVTEKGVEGRTISSAGRNGFFV